jgi:hypothetical protein
LSTKTSYFLVPISFWISVCVCLKVLPKKLASIYCPQCREIKADTLKATEANRRRGPGTREKVSLRRINLEGNTHAQEINVSQLPV